MGGLTPGGATSIGEGLDAARAQFPMPGQALAAWCGELREDEALAKFGIALQQALDRQELLFETLGVIEAIDADAEFRLRRQAQLTSDAFAANFDGGTARRPPARPSH